MSWIINEELIMDGNRLVGSIVRTRFPGERYFVEIMWTPDITFEANSYAEAVAFIRGVEAMFNAISQP